MRPPIFSEGRPSFTAGGPCCIFCARSGRDAAICRHGDGRSHLTCPHGLRCPSTCHDPVVRTLIRLLDARVGSQCVIGERLHDRRALREWCTTTAQGQALPKRPDLVVLGLDGPGSACVIDVKTGDAGLDSFLAAPCSSHSIRDSFHAVKERDSRHDYFGAMDGGKPRDELLLSLCTFSVSTSGTIGPEAQAFLDHVSTRRGCTVPCSLLGEASWAVPVFSLFARQAIGLSIRRSLALALRSMACSRAIAADASPMPPPPARPPRPPRPPPPLPRLPATPSHPAGPPVLLPGPVLPPLPFQLPGMLGPTSFSGPAPVSVPTVVGVVPFAGPAPGFPSVGWPPLPVGEVPHAPPCRIG